MAKDQRYKKIMFTYDIVSLAGERFSLANQFA